MLTGNKDYVPPCATQGDPEGWFSNRAATQEECKKICATCLMTMACLSSAIEFERASKQRLRGVHGGKTEEERSRIESFTQIAF